MNSSSSQPTPPVVGRRRIWPWILGSFFVVMLCLGVSIAQAVRLSGDANALRREIVDSLETKTSARVQVTLGPVALTTARAILSFIDEVPEEARVACRSVRSVSVGVYDVREAQAGAREAAFARATAMMERRGWNSVVRVNDGDNAVLVFLPAKAKQPDHVCVAVWESEQLVVCSVRANAERLAELALQCRHGRFQL